VSCAEQVADGTGTAEQPETVKDLRNKSVLVIDDDAGMLRALTKALTGEGLVVAGASDSAAAMDYLISGNSKFDVIITDLRMPGLDGIEVLDLVKTRRPNIPVIIITAYGTGAAQAAAAQLGAAAYLEKPVATDELLTAIKSAMSSSRL
jgi:DNA-binding NtrC family response regulator